LDKPGRKGQIHIKKISLFDFGVGQVLTFDPLFQGRAGAFTFFQAKKTIAMTPLRSSDPPVLWLTQYGAVSVN
jgi:hypothetical protein